MVTLSPRISHRIILNIRCIQHCIKREFTKDPTLSVSKRHIFNIKIEKVKWWKKIYVENTHPKKANTVIKTTSTAKASLVRKMNVHDRMMLSNTQRWFSASTNRLGKPLFFPRIQFLKVYELLCVYDSLFKTSFRNHIILKFNDFLFELRDPLNYIPLDSRKSVTWNFTCWLMSGTRNCFRKRSSSLQKRRMSGMS